VLFGLVKFLTWLASPLVLGVLGVLAGGYWVWRDNLRRGLWSLALSVVWLWVWASPWFLILVGGSLERGFPPAKVETLPRADVIVVLGGGIGAPTEQTQYAELFAGADRGWHAARCYHAGRAPVILFSGVGEGPSMKQFLTDLGVPAAKIVLESESKNTYQNGVFTREKLKAMKAKKVILVTSAWHLRRSVLTFKRMGMEVVPAGADYEALTMKGSWSPGMMNYWLPNADCLSKNSAMLKEHIGYWAYWCWLKVKREQHAAGAGRTTGKDGSAVV
jgi:uncharacterized SAM-binding protein YcdF (DUF218 family)